MSSRKPLCRRLLNRCLSSMAKNAPGASTFRPLLHRMRGVKIYGKVFIGEEVIIENEYPECVEIYDGAHIGLRSIVMAHFQGKGRVIIRKNAQISINSVIIAFKDETIEIGENAGVGISSLVRKSVPPNIFVAGIPAKPKARITVPFGFDVSYDDYRSGLVRLTEEERRELES